MRTLFNAGLTAIIFTSSLLFVAYGTVLFNGCATVSPLPTVCDEAPIESVICPKLAEINIQFEDIELLMQIALVRLAEKEDLAVINKHKKILLGMLETSPAEAIFSYWADITDELTAPEILLLNRYLSVLSVDQVLCEFDQELIKRLLL